MEYWFEMISNHKSIPIIERLLTGYSKSNASHAAWRTALVGYMGAPGDVKLYKQVFNLVLVAILNSNPAEMSL